MVHLPSEVLLRIFKYLNSTDMVRNMCVCKSWSLLIDQNKFLWRKLVLPKRENGWHLNRLHQFDQKCESTLEEVSFETNCFRRPEFEFKQVLLKSKETLSHIKLVVETEFFSNTLMSSKEYWEKISEINWQLPNLIDSRITVNNDMSKAVRRVHLMEGPQGGINPSPASNKPGEANDDSEEKDNPKVAPSKLKVLWIPTLDKIPDTHLHLLDNLASLSFQEPMHETKISSLLAKPSQTLKHLQIMLRDPAIASHDYFQETENVPVPVFLSNLRVLELGLHTSPPKFPEWLRIPPRAALNIFTNERPGLSFSSGNKIPSNLPSVEKLWIKSTRDFSKLDRKCPLLRELRISAGSFDKDSRAALLGFLERRRESAQKKVEIDGVQMIPLQRVFAIPKGLGDCRAKIEALVELVDTRKFQYNIQVVI